MSLSPSPLGDSIQRHSARSLTRREALAVMGTAAASVCCWDPSADAVASKSSQPSHRLGVSLAGPEFGAHHPGFCNTQLGRLNETYTYPCEKTIHYFTSAGLGLFRIPFRWERLQPTLGGNLASGELSQLRQTIRSVARAGGKSILDLHNYGRYHLEYQGSAREIILNESINGNVPVHQDHLADLWTRLAAIFHQDKSVIGYGLMNEPHDMGASQWKTISQHVVNAIREVDQKTHLLIAGDGWSNAHRWAEIHSETAWIHDPAGRFAYEAHCYFDANASGKYHLSFDEELKRDPQIWDRGLVRVSHFLNWCQRNRVAGFLGEFGIPRYDANWRKVLERFLAAVTKADFPACYWAAGEWWGDYPLSIQPRNLSDDYSPLLNLLLKYSRKA